MKAFRTGHYFLALFFTGFLTGILIVNYIWGEQLSLIGTFTEVYLMRLKNEKISFQQYRGALERSPLTSVMAPSTSAGTPGGCPSWRR